MSAILNLPRVLFFSCIISFQFLPLLNFIAIFGQTIFPDNAYGVDSGGDPTAIPSLTFDYFKGFHQRFYHPGNSRVYFYGDDPPLKVSSPRYLYLFYLNYTTNMYDRNSVIFATCCCGVGFWGDV